MKFVELKFSLYTVMVMHLMLNKFNQNLLLSKKEIVSDIMKHPILNVEIFLFIAENKEIILIQK